MNTSHFAAVVGTAALCALAPAMAQTPATDEDQVIVVEAPRAVPLPPAPKSPEAEHSATTGAPSITTTVKISALYGDLDLSRPDHAARLMTRIERVARDACATLDRLYPLTPDADCVGRAVAKARPAAVALIANSARR